MLQLNWSDAIHAGRSKSWQGRCNSEKGAMLVTPGVRAMEPGGPESLQGLKHLRQNAEFGDVLHLGKLALPNGNQ